MAILEFRPAGAASDAGRDATAAVLRAYGDALRARRSCRLLAYTVPFVALLVTAASAAHGALTRDAAAALALLSTAVVGSAGWTEWRAARRVAALVRSTRTR